jgi:hypothetical protein
MQLTKPCNVPKMRQALRIHMQLTNLCNVPKKRQALRIHTKGIPNLVTDLLCSALATEKRHDAVVQIESATEICCHATGISEPS